MAVFLSCLGDVLIFARFWGHIRGLVGDWESYEGKVLEVAIVYLPIRVAESGLESGLAVGGVAGAISVLGFSPAGAGSSFFR